MAAEDEKMFSCKEFASVLDIKVSTLYKYLHTGKLKAVHRTGMRPVFPESYVKHVLASGYENNPNKD